MIDGAIAKDLRRRRGYSQATFSQATGLSIRTIRNLETGIGEPSPETVRAVAAVLEVSIDELMPKAIPEDVAPEPRPTSMSIPVSSSARRWVGMLYAIARLSLLGLALCCIPYWMAVFQVGVHAILGATVRLLVPTGSRSALLASAVVHGLYLLPSWMMFAPDYAYKANRALRYPEVGDPEALRFVSTVMETGNAIVLASCIVLLAFAFLARRADGALPGWLDRSYWAQARDEIVAWRRSGGRLRVEDLAP